MDFNNTHYYCLLTLLFMQLLFYIYVLKQTENVITEWLLTLNLIAHNFFVFSPKYRLYLLKKIKKMFFINLALLYSDTIFYKFSQYLHQGRV